MPGIPRVIVSYFHVSNDCRRLLFLCIFRGALPVFSPPYYHHLRPIITFEKIGIVFKIKNNNFYIKIKIQILNHKVIKKIKNK